MERLSNVIVRCGCKAPQSLDKIRPTGYLATDLETTMRI